MANIREWLEDAVEAYGEPLEAVVVGQHYDTEVSYPRGAHSVPPQHDENVILSPAAALAKLDADFCDSYGAADCFPIYAWTKSRVFFIHEYDGSTDLMWAPRAPMAVAPGFGGNDVHWKPGAV